MNKDLMLEQAMHLLREVESDSRIKARAMELYFEYLQEVEEDEKSKRQRELVRI